MVLLAILQLNGGAFALAVLNELEGRAGRSVSRGSLYKTLERLEAKGYLTWSPEPGSPERGGHPRRCFSVSVAGMASLRESRAAFNRLWEGLDGAAEV